MFKFTKKIPESRKLLPYALGLLVLAVIIFVLFIYKGVLSFNIQQSNAKIMISDKLITSNKVALSPGYYQIRVSAPGYVEYKRDLGVKSGNRFMFEINLKELPKAQLLGVDQASFMQTDDNNNLYFLGNNSTIYRLANSSLMAITPPNLSGIENLQIMPDGQLAFFKRGEDLYLYDFKRYDLLHQESTKLLSGVKNFVVDPTGGKIAYVQHLSTGEKVLVKSFFNGQNGQIILNLKANGLDNPKLYWSKDYNHIYLVENNLYSLNVSTLEYKKIFDGIKDIKPDNSGPLLLAEKTDSQLIILNEDGQSMYDLQINGLAKAASWQKGNSSLVIARNDGQIFKADLTAERARACQYEGFFVPFDTQILDSDNLAFTSQGKPYILTIETGWN